MSRSPIPLTEVLNYLRLEDAEGLVPGSVKYVGHFTSGGRTTHYWSFPSGTRLGWACWDGDSLGEADQVPSVIRRKTAPLELHRVQRSPAPPKSAWTGQGISELALPRWVPASKVRMIDASYVASFEYNFGQAAAVFNAKPSTDKQGGGSGPCKYFFLELSRNRLAMLECEDRNSTLIYLYLPEKQGRVYWEDYDQVMNPLGVPLERAFRQGGLNWKHRRPTPEAIKRTQDHYKKIWTMPGRMIIEE